MKKMKSSQRKAMFAEYDKLRMKAMQGDKRAQRDILKINQSEGWTEEDRLEQESFQKMLRGDRNL